MARACFRFYGDKTIAYYTAHAHKDMESLDTCHQWSADFKEHISTTIKDRNDAIAKGEEAFSDTYVEDFHRKIDEYLENGWSEKASFGLRTSACQQQTTFLSEG